MGQTWIVVAIVVAGVAIALIAFFLGRGRKAPAAKKSPAKEAGASATPAPERTSEAPNAGGPTRPAAAGGEVADKGTPSRAKTVPEPAVRRQATSRELLPEQLHEDDDDDITIVTLTPRLDLLAAAAEAALPDALHDDDDDEDDGGLPESHRATAVPIFADAEATEDEPTRVQAVILVGAVGQTDRGQKRKINEDRYMVLDDHNLYVVADGMGGHAGGEVASQLAVDTIAAAFKEGRFDGEPYSNVPRRAGELALAIQMANRAIYDRAKREIKLQGMGTTIVSARFTPGKERVYIGHVGDSRCYRFRQGQLTQLTTDHTMGAVGMTGPFADHLSRAVGIAPHVKVDVVIAKPRHEDVFLLCSDGLSKMVKDDAIRELLAANPDPDEAAKALVQRANERGGRDNITVILVVVKDPKGFARHVRKKAAEAAAAAVKEGDPDIVMNEPEALSMASAAAVLDPKMIAEGKAALEGLPAAEAKAAAEAKPVAEAKPAAEAKPVAEAKAAAEAKATSVPAPARAGTSTPPPRPSVPPRPGAADARASAPPRASVPPRAGDARPGVPEARKSSPEGRPSAPEARKSAPEARKSAPEAPARSAEAPARSAEAPKGAPGAPEHSPEAPEHSPEAPEHSPKAPAHSPKAPEHALEAAARSAEAAARSAEAPARSAEAPKGAPEAPKGASEAKASAPDASAPSKRRRNK